jgi:Tol biopolymer transport system component
VRGFHILGGLALAAFLAVPGATATGNGSLVFSSYDTHRVPRSGSLYTIEPDGTGLKRLGGAGRDAAWSPDGSKIAFTIPLEDSPGFPSAEPPGLYVMGSDGSGAAKLVGGAIFYPTWSPDGSRIAFLVGVDSVYSLQTVRPDGNGQVTIGADATKLRPDWSPDGSKLMYTRVIPGSADGMITIVPLGSGGAQEIVGENPSFSPDGTKIAFLRTDASGSYLIQYLYVAGADGADPRKISSTQTCVCDYPPSWSPDGTQLAFVGHVGPPERYSGRPSKSEIYVIRADGTDERALTDVRKSEAPVWSPDGMRITFVTSRDSDNGNGELYTMNRDGTCETRMTHFPFDYTAELTPAGWNSSATTAASQPISCADLAVQGSLTVMNDRPYLDRGRPYVYDVVVTNAGNVPAAAPRLNVTLPLRASAVSASADGTCTLGSTVICTLRPLGPGSEEHARIVFHALAEREGAAVARIASDQSDGDTSNNVAGVARTFPFCLLATSPRATIRGTTGPDLLCGTNGPDRIFGRSDADRINAGAGNDWIDGGSGHDVIDAGEGNDRVFGGATNDAIHGGDGNDRIIGGHGRDFIWGDDGNDVIFTAGDGAVDYVYCATGFDRVVADRFDHVFNSNTCERVTYR